MLEQRIRFIGERWLDETVDQVVAQLPRPDKESDTSARKPPMGIVRMARGGKTRALQELTDALRARGKVAIFISFNDDTIVSP